MAERKRFQSQTLNNKDYEKTEEGAKAVKNGIAVFGGLAIVVGVAKKYGPALLRNVSKLLKG